MPPNKGAPLKSSTLEAAALATVDKPDPLAHPVAMVEMEVSVNRVNLANLENKLLRIPLFCNASPNNARALLLLVTKAHLAAKVPMDQLETQAHPVLTANLVTKDPADLPAKMASPDNPVKKARPARPVTQFPKSVLPALLVALAAPVLLALPVNLALVAKMVAPEDPAPLAKVAPLATLENQARKDQMEKQENKATPAAARTAHRLVWLLAIKRIGQWLWFKGHHSLGHVLRFYLSVIITEIEASCTARFFSL